MATATTATAAAAATSSPPSVLVPGIVAADADAAARSHHDGLPFHKYMIAGSIAGVVEHTAMFPIDTIKTHMQVPRLNGVGNGVLSALVTTVRGEGAVGLYRGIAAMTLGAGPAHAVYFSVYELMKKTLSASHEESPAVHAASGIAATVASDAVLTPMDTAKQRLQLGAYKNLADCMARVVREEGFRALYASYGTTVVMNAPFTAVHFAAYEAAKRSLGGAVDVGEEGLAVHATAGAAAGALAAVVTTPLDVVKTHLQCQGVCGCDRFAGGGGSIPEVAKAIVRRGGYGALMRGWMPRTLFHAPAAAICWSTYEAAKSFFRSSDAGDDDDDGASTNP